MKTPKIRRNRADQLVFEQGLAESREQAKRFIMAGQVYVSLSPLPAVRVDKPGHPYPSDAHFTLTGQNTFVSRGAYKLLTALETFALDVHGFICLDAGASTGGFTDCLLQHGAAKVYAVDVGHGQLHEKLQKDTRVINLERTNLRTAPPELIPEQVDIIVADVSFISLTQVLPPCVRWLKNNGHLVTLIKPQFELGPHQTDKGVVRDANLRQIAVDKIVHFCETDLALHLKGIEPAAIKGPKGNQEYLAWFSRNTVASQ